MVTLGVGNAAFDQPFDFVGVHRHCISPSGCASRHIARQPSFKAAHKRRYKNGALGAAKSMRCPQSCQAFAPELRPWPPFPARPLASRGFDRHQITALVLAEPEGMRELPRGRLQLGADAGRHGHFRERHQQAAVGQIMHRRRLACRDQAAHEIAVAALGARDRPAAARPPPARRRRADRATGRASRGRRRSARIVSPSALNAKRRGFGKILEQPDATDGGRGQDRAALRLVVKRHIAGDDREIQRLGRLPRCRARSRRTGP